jgi:hypothetical protein
MPVRSTKCDSRTVNNISSTSRPRSGSIVPFPPPRGGRFRFPSSQYARCVEVHHDLRKFITERVVAQSCDVLSSGREASRAACGDGPSNEVSRTDRQIDNVKRLTPGVVIESFTRLGSDQKAADALQEAETELGVRVLVDRDVLAGRAGDGQLNRSAYPVIDVGLTA